VAVPPPAPEPSPAGWVADAVLDPTAFGSLMDRTGRDGWIALHANDLAGAVATFPATDAEGKRARARAELELAVLDDDLARMQALAASRFFDAWATRGGPPAGSAAPTIAALAGRCRDADPALWPASADAADPYAARRAVHAQARKGDPAALLAVASQPLVTEPGDGFTRAFWDPCLHATLSDAWLARAAADSGAATPDWKAVARTWTTPDAGLGGVLLAPWLTRDALTAELESAASPGLLGATVASLGALGIEPVPTMTTDDAEAARRDAHRMIEAVDAWRTDLLARANDDGKGLVVDLHLPERFRQEWLVSRARLHLVNGRPRAAAATLLLARDASEPGVGPANSPALFALTAEAELTQGHTREALDALDDLEAAYPAVHGLGELVGDLAVLEGIDRRGDSKEN
jgi:hypothetical protein